MNLGHGHGDPIYSEKSVVIATLAAGIPASPPMHVRAAPVDAHSVSVSWEPGPFPHGPLLSYVLQITDNNPSGGREARSEVKVGRKRAQKKTGDNQLPFLTLAVCAFKEDTHCLR